MARLFRRHPRAIERTQEIVERCSFSLDQLTYQYPVDVRGRRDAAWTSSCG